MLYLKNRVLLAAIPAVMLSAVSAFATEIVPIPVPPVAAPASAPETTRGYNKSIKENDLHKYIKDFKVRVIRTDADARLQFTGLVPKDCLPHLRLELDKPASDDQNTDYHLRIERADIVSAADNNKIVTEADKACDPIKARQCDRFKCADISEVLGANGAMATSIAGDPKVLFKIEDLDKPANDPDAVVYREIPKINGGPIEIKSVETLRLEAKKRKEKEKEDAIAATCNDAMKGDREAIEDLRQLLGASGVAANKKLFERLEENATNVEIGAFEARINEAETITELNALIDEIRDFGKSNKKLVERAKKLIVLIAERAKGLENDKDTNDQQFTVAKKRLSQRAFKVARTLTPRDKSLWVQEKKALFDTGKYAAKTGNEAFFNDSIRNEMDRAFEDAYTKAVESNDPMYATLATDLYNELYPQMGMPSTVMTPWGPMMSMVPISKLDYQFMQSKQEKMNRNYSLGGRNAPSAGGNPSNAGSSMMYVR